jgi:hypothetical protein
LIWLDVKGGDISHLSWSSVNKIKSTCFSRKTCTFYTGFAQFRAFEHIDPLLGVTVLLLGIFRSALLPGGALVPLFFPGGGDLPLKKKKTFLIGTFVTFLPGPRYL